MWRFNEVRNVRRHSFEDYSLRLPLDEQQALQLVLAAMKVLLLQVLSPKRVAGLGGPDGNARAAEPLVQHSPRRSVVEVQG